MNIPITTEVKRAKALFYTEKPGIYLYYRKQYDSWYIFRMQKGQSKLAKYFVKTLLSTIRLFIDSKMKSKGELIVKYGNIEFKVCFVMFHLSGFPSLYIEKNSKENIRIKLMTNDENIVENIEIEGPVTKDDLANLNKALLKELL